MKRKILLTIICALLLVGCKVSKEDKQQMENDRISAKEAVTSYVKEKYNFNAKVIETYGSVKTFAINRYYDGDIVVKLEHENKYFYVWINEKEKIAKDTYQNEEIEQDVWEYINKNTNGTIKEIKSNTFNGSDIRILDKEVNKIFQNNTFYDVKYEKKDMFTFIRNATFTIYTIGSDLHKFYTDIISQTKEITDNERPLWLVMIDFVDTSSYETFKENHAGSNNDIKDFGVLIDESIVLDKQEDDPSSPYLSYQKNAKENLKLSYPDSYNVTIDSIDPKTFIDKSKSKLDDESLESLDKVNIEKVFHIKADYTNISFLLTLNGYKVEDNYQIIKISPRDGKLSAYLLNMESGVMSQKKGKDYTDFFFESTINVEQYILICTI